jgi:hypothetical protein
MHKSTHNYTISSGIKNEELTNFINPINMTLFVPKCELYNVFHTTIETDAYFKRYFKEIFDLIPNYPDDMIIKFINGRTGITYTPHTSGYDFRFHPIDFFNELFQSMRLDYEIPFINLDNGYGMNYLKDYVRAYINDFKRDKSKENLSNYETKVKVMEDIDKNLDQICHMYYTSLDNMIDHNVVAKDMLLYLAFTSLNKYEQTKDEKYLVFPYEYYTYVSHMRTSPFPHMVQMGNQRLWFNEFRTKYSSLYDPSIRVDDNKHILNDHELLLAWDILKPGMLERQIRDTHEYARSAPNVDYDKYLALFEKKMQYYMNSPYINYIQGKYGLNGYIGFSYKNEYLVFDKFHNSETIDPTKKTILTHGEAIYALPSDRFDVVKGDKQRVIDARKADPRIIKINHTPSFTDRLDDVIQGPNVSYTTFDKVIQNEKRKMLIKQ